jgi:hypothetical protein
MRSLLREALFGVHGLLRDCEHATTLGPRGEKRVRRVLELCRRATARDPRPDWLVPLTRTMPASIADTVATFDRLLVPLKALESAWRQRLVAAGIDPKGLDSDA